MIVIRRATERRHELRGQQEIWLTFDPQNRAGPLAEGFNALQTLNENRIPPGGSSPTLLQRDVEMLSYVLEGSLAFDDALGRSGVLTAGEFRCLTAARDVRCTETNASRAHWAHVFQIWLRSPNAGNQPAQEQKRFSTADRHGEPCLVASLDARRGSLQLRHDASVYSTLSDKGQHSIFDLGPDRSAWVHVVAGEIRLGDLVLAAGDGAGVSGERAVSFTARQRSDVLLLDLPDRRIPPVAPS